MAARKRTGQLRLSILLLVASALFVFGDDVSRELRPTAYSIIAALRQYDGCSCDDCAAHFVGFTPGYHRGCCIRVGPSLFRASVGGVCGVLGLLLGAHSIAAAVRSPSPGLCAHCRYDLTGLASPTCPECGSLKPTSGGGPRRTSA